MVFIISKCQIGFSKIDISISVKCFLLILKYRLLRLNSISVNSKLLILLFSVNLYRFYNERIGLVQMDGKSIGQPSTTVSFSMLSVDVIVVHAL